MNNHFSKWYSIRMVIIGVTILAIILKQASFWFPVSNRVDMLYIGERIASARTTTLSQSIFAIDKPFYLHGYFLEVGEAIVAFKLFGVSISSFLLLDMILVSLTYALFMVLLNKIIKNDLIYIIASVLFLGINLRYRILNNLITIIYFLYLSYIVNKRVPTFSDLLKLSFLVLLNFTYSVEFAFYLAGLHIYLTTVLTLRNIKKSKIGTIQTNHFYLFLGLSSVLLLLLSHNSFRDYIYRVIVVTPQLPFYIFKPHIPPLTINTIVPYYSPLILILINGIYLYTLPKEKYQNGLLTHAFFVIGVVNMYGIFVRADVNMIYFDSLNISYFIHYQFLVAFIILDKYLIVNKRKLETILFGALIIVISLPFIDLKHLNPLYNVPKLVHFISKMPHITDDQWIRKEARAVSTFIKANTTLKDRIYVFDNESMYYYLTNRKNATAFDVAAVAEPIELQLETIESLKKNQPKYIIYSSDYWTNTMESTPQPERLYLVNNYLLQNFPIRTTIGSTIILSK